MINSVIVKETEKETPKLEAPCLMEYTDEGHCVAFVVMATKFHNHDEQFEGVVVSNTHPDSTTRVVGEFDTDWATELFTKFEHSVTLSNS